MELVDGLEPPTC